MIKILVIGQKGQVAEALAHSRLASVEIIALGRPELDITNKESILAKVLQYQPDFIVNAAAFTQVDEAEINIEPAFLVNRDGAGYVSEVSQQFGIPIIHISTDYVFNGASESPYDEKVPASPVSVYGLSKLQGEWAVAKANPKHIILRTAWVYSDYGRNFKKTMLALAKTHKTLNIVADQWGSPTHASFIASAIIEICQTLHSKPSDKFYGLYNLVADGITNWADFAQEIFNTYIDVPNERPLIEKILSHQYPTRAKRPQFSKLDNAKIKRVFGLQIKAWQQYL